MRFARWLALVPALLLAPPSIAADVVYPPGSRIGLTPPPGVVTSSNFYGFEDRDRNVAIVITVLPAAAFAEIERTASAETLRRQGVTLDSSEPISLPIGKAILITGHQEADNMRFRKYLQVTSTPALTALITVQVPESAGAAYPDDAIRSALASIAVRASIPADEQLSLLPFEVADLSGFNVTSVLPHRAVMLADGDPAAGPPEGAHIVVALAPGAPEQAADREAFARDVFATVPNLRDVRVTNAEMLRLSGTQTHQIMASAVDALSGAEVSVVQWIRFGNGAFLHMVGVVPTAGWSQAYPRFRAVRDGIGPR
jgi:hypothetical protein